MKMPRALEEYRNEVRERRKAKERVAWAALKARVLAARAPLAPRIAKRVAQSMFEPLRLPVKRPWRAPRIETVSRPIARLATWCRWCGGRRDDPQTHGACVGCLPLE